MDKFPIEICIEIFNHLGPKSVLTLSETCRWLKNVADDYMEHYSTNSLCFNIKSHQYEHHNLKGKSIMLIKMKKLIKWLPKIQTLNNPTPEMIAKLMMFDLKITKRNPQSWCPCDCYLFVPICKWKLKFASSGFVCVCLHHETIALIQKSLFNENDHVEYY
jgi:hypothetical protein